MNGDVLNTKRCRVLDFMRNNLIQRNILLRKIYDFLSVWRHFEAKDKNGTSSSFSQEYSVLVIDVPERHVDVCWTNERHSCISFNLKVLVIDIVKKRDKIILIEIEVEMIEKNTSWSDKRIVLIVNNHQNWTLNSSVVYCFGISLVRSKSKRFFSYRWSNVYIDLVSQLTQRYYELLIVPCCHFSANLTVSCGRNHIDVMNRIVVSESFEDGRVLLSINSIVWRLNVVNSSALYHYTVELNVILNGGRIFTFCVGALKSIVEHISVKPVSIVDLNNSLVSGLIFGWF